MRRRTPNLTTLYRSPTRWQRRSSCSDTRPWPHHQRGVVREQLWQIVLGMLCFSRCVNGQLNDNHESSMKTTTTNSAVPRLLLFFARTLLSQPGMSWHLPLTTWVHAGAVSVAGGSWRQTGRAVVSLLGLAAAAQRVVGIIIGSL